MPTFWLLVPFVVQAVAMTLDEALHRGRGLPRWERIGHPLDTCTVAVCYGWLVGVAPTRATVLFYAAFAALSSLFVTKDERVHARACSPAEHWLHALLFVLHPTVLIAAGWLWYTGRLRAVLVAELVLATSFAVYQAVYWNMLGRPEPPRGSERRPLVNAP